MPKTTETVAAEMPAEEKTHRSPAKQQLIYVGADVPGMKHNTVFIGDIPKVINVPFVQELCVDVKDYTKTMAELKDSTSRAAFCYRKSTELAVSLNTNKEV